MSVEYENNLGRITQGIVDGAIVGVNKAAERLKSFSVLQAPMDEDGDLVLSAAVELATLSDPTAEVVYDTPYAARWHEDAALVDSLGRRYKGGSNFQDGRKSHYLSEPAEQNIGEFERIIATESARGASQ